MVACPIPELKADLELVVGDYANIIYNKFRDFTDQMIIRENGVPVDFGDANAPTIGSIANALSYLYPEIQDDDFFNKATIALYLAIDASKVSITLTSEAYVASVFALADILNIDVYTLTMAMNGGGITLGKAAELFDAKYNKALSTLKFSDTLEFFKKKMDESKSIINARYPSSIFDSKDLSFVDKVVKEKDNYKRMLEQFFQSEELETFDEDIDNLIQLMRGFKAISDDKVKRIMDTLDIRRTSNLPPTDAQTSVLSRYNKSLESLDIRWENNRQKFFFNGEQLSGVKRKMEEDPYYSYEGDQSNTDSIEIGESIDEAFRLMVEYAYTYKTREAMSDMLKEQGFQPQWAKALAIQFFQTVGDSLNDGSILMAQVPLFSEKEKLVGVADIIVVKPNGTIRIYDVKASKSSFSDKSYRNERIVDGKKKASRYQSHQKQLSMYDAMLTSMIGDYHTSQTAVIPVNFYEYDSKILISDKSTFPIPTFTLQEDINMFNSKPTDAKVRDIFQKIIGTQAGEFINKVNRNVVRLQSAFKKYKRSVASIKVLNELEGAYNLFDTFIRISEVYKVQLESENFGILNQIIKRDILNTDVEGDMIEKQINNVQRYIELTNAIDTQSYLLYLNAIDKSLSDLPGIEDTTSAREYLSDMRKLVSELDTVKVRLDDARAKLLAKFLAKGFNKASDTAVRLYKNWISKAENFKSKGKHDYAREAYIKAEDVKTKYGLKTLENGVVIASAEDGFYDQLTRGFADTTMVYRYAMSLLDSNNDIVQSFAMKYDSALYKALRENAVVESKIGKLAKAYNVNLSKNPEEAYKDMLQLVTTTYEHEGELKERQVYYFVTPFDYVKYNATRAEMFKNIKSMTKEERDAVVKKFIEDHTEPSERIEENGVVLQEGWRAIAAKEKAKVNEGLITVEEYEAWKEKNFDKDGNPSSFVLRQPKKSLYSNAAFESILTGDPNKRELFFNCLRTTFDAYKRANKRYSGMQRFLYPTNPKSFSEAISSGTMGQHLSESVKSLVGKSQSQNTTELNNEPSFEIDYNEELFIPVWSESYSKAPKLMLHNMQMDHRDVSLNIPLTTILFDRASREHEVNSTMSEIGNSLLGEMEGKVVEDDKGIRVADRRYNPTAGKTPTLLRKNETSKAEKAIEDMIEFFMYRNNSSSNTVDIGGVKVDALQVMKKVGGAMSAASLPLDIFGRVANSLNASMQNIIYASGGETLTPSKLAWAQAELMKLTTEQMRFGWTGEASNKLSALMRLYEPIKGQYYDETGRALTETAFNKLVSSNTYFLMSNLSEYIPQMTMWLAHMDSVTIPTKSGKRMTLWEAYVFNERTKSVELSEDVDMQAWSQSNELLNLGENGVIDWSFQQKHYAINRELQGNYKLVDRTMAGRTWLGYALEFFRKYLVPGWQARWQKGRISASTGDYKIGRYRAMYQLFWGTSEKEGAAKVFENLFNGVNKLYKTFVEEQDDMLPEERAAIKRGIIEHLVIIVLGGLTMLIGRYGFDDDDELEGFEKFNILALYYGVRLNAELSLYGAPGDPTNSFLPGFGEMFKQLNTVSFLGNYIQKTYKFSQLVLGDAFSLATGGDIERYQAKSGFFEKGDSKTVAAFMKQIGVDRPVISIEDAYKNLMLTKGARDLIVKEEEE